MESGQSLPNDFYDRDSREVAIDLLGCTIAHETDEGNAVGIIVETEAYRQYDPACHAYSGPTMRNRNLFARPGVAYVYLSYGIHSLINLVCEEEGYGSAVLLRAIRPTDGMELMQKRRGAKVKQRDLTNGPGKLSQALGVDVSMDGTDLGSGSLKILSGDFDALEGETVSTTRIGISKGVELPWRYLAAGERDVSVRPGEITKTGLKRYYW